MEKIHMDSLNLSQIFTYAATGVGALGLGLYLKSAFYTVQQQTEALITSFGKYVRTEKDPGLHMKWPAPFEKVSGNPSTATYQAGNTLETKTTTCSSICPSLSSTTFLIPRSSGSTATNRSIR
jgi:hypothetical protein